MNLLLNSAADGLSRGIMELTSEEFERSQREDPEFDREMMRKKHGVWNFKERLFVPGKFRKALVEERHGEAHFGVARTLNELRRSYYWKGLGSDVKQLIGNCEQCIQKMVPKNHPVAMMGTSYPFQRIHLDFAGPFKQSRRGHRYFLILQDDFSKFLRVIPSKEVSSDVVIRALKTTILEDGVPAMVMSDNGGAFTSRSFKDFCNQYAIEHVTSPPGHQSSNGLAERAVQTVKQHMRTLDGVEIEEKLFRIQKGYNTSVNPALGFSPFEIARGRSLPFASRVLGNVRGIVKKVDVDWRNLGDAVMKNKERSNARRVSTARKKLVVGEKVWVFDRKAKVWLGPVKITNVEGNGRVVSVERYGRFSEDNVWMKSVDGLSFDF